MNKKSAKIFFDILDKSYPDLKCALNFKGAFQLLIATILSAQCTDKKVNEVTPELFAKYKTVKDFADAKKLDIEKIIRPTGFYKQKTISIINCSKELLDKYSGKVPDKMDDLIKLRGVGRKTASVVLAYAFKIPAIPVDTHVKRLSFRMGFTDNTDPDKIEQDLRILFSEDLWIRLSHVLINHGRQICIARKPLCDSCPVTSICAKRISK